MEQWIEFYQTKCIIIRNETAVSVNEIFSKICSILTTFTMFVLTVAVYPACWILSVVMNFSFLPGIYFVLLMTRACYYMSHTNVGSSMIKCLLVQEDKAWFSIDMKARVWYLILKALWFLWHIYCSYSYESIPGYHEKLLWNKNNETGGN